jgi:hypothetical protein
LIVFDKGLEDAIELLLTVIYETLIAVLFDFAFGFNDSDIYVPLELE